MFNAIKQITTIFNYLAVHINAFKQLFNNELILLERPFCWGLTGIEWLNVISFFWDNLWN